MEPTPHGSGSDEHGATSRPAGRQWEKTLDEQFDDAEGLGDDGLLVVAPSGVTPGDLDDLFAELAGTRRWGSRGRRFKSCRPDGRQARWHGAKAQVSGLISFSGSILRDCLLWSE